MSRFIPDETLLSSCNKQYRCVTIEMQIICYYYQSQEVISI